MSAFKFSHYQWGRTGTANCQCFNFLTRPSRYSCETEDQDEKHQSRFLYEDPRTHKCYFMFHSDLDEDHFSSCVEMAYAWATSRSGSCWLSIKKFSPKLDFSELSHVNLPVHTMSFGSLLDHKTFVPHFTQQNISLSFFHDQRKLWLNLPCKSDDETKRLVLPYHSIFRILLSFPPCGFFPKTKVNIYLHLKYSPEMFHNRDQVISFQLSPQEKLEGATLGKASFIKLTMDLDSVLKALEALHSCTPQLSFTVAHITESEPKPYLLKDPECAGKLCFSCHYAWNVLHNNFYWVNDSIAFQTKYSYEELIHRLLNLETASHHAFQKTCYEVYLAQEQGRLFDVLKAFKRFFERNMKEDKDMLPPPGMCVIRKVILTPIKKIYQPPQQHSLNRFLRNYRPEYALQVCIKQEDMEKLTHHVQTSNNLNFMQKTFQLHLGFKVGKRTYQFLGCSNSQLRDHGFWMYAKDDDGVTAEKIMENIGFDKIEGNEVKKLTKMGLFFTSSENNFILPASCKVIEDYKDVESKTKDKIFSDGVGKISSSMAHLLRRGYTSGYQPTAFQIRYPGFKGMLVEDPTLKGDQVYFRKSMHKFMSNTSEKVIEVIKTSAPRRLFLNRSLIMILEQKKVPKAKFVNMQKDMICNLLKALTDNDEAANLLATFVTIKYPVRTLVEVGLPITIDPFFRRLLCTIFRKRLMLLRSKASIAIDPAKGRNMFGVLDETFTLEPGEVFIRYNEEMDTAKEALPRVLKGRVLVTRNPCHHPGDVRFLTAVRTEKVLKRLGHHMDCVVFPAKGDWPEMDKMGGGDLDGDEYVVIWDQDFICQNDEPMDYPTSSSQNTLNTGVQVKDLANAVYNFILNDNIGVYSNAHLVAGDLEPKGIYSEKCKSIARKIPLALDYLKTGYIEPLKQTEKPVEYPDFMEKGSHKSTYRSKKILGQLYRTASMFLPSGIRCLDVPIAPFKCFEYKGWQIFENDAKQEKIKYEATLHTLLSTHGVATLEECLADHISSRYNISNNERESLFSIMEKNISELARNTRAVFSNLCQNHPDPEVKLKLASAWYMVTYTDETTTDLSFPWCIADELCNVARAKTGGNPSSENTISYIASVIRIGYRFPRWNPLDMLYNWAEVFLRKSFYPLKPYEKAFLRELYLSFCEKDAKNFYDGRPDHLLGHLMKFFKWLSFSKLDLPQSQENEIYPKLVILASITLSCLPLTLDPGYLGLQKQEPDDDEPWMPLVPRDAEVFQMDKRKFPIENLAKVEKVIKEVTGVEHLHFINKFSDNVVCVTRALQWQIFYLGKIIYDIHERTAAKNRS